MTPQSSTLTNILSGLAAAGLGTFIYLQSRHLSAMGSVFPTTIAVALVGAGLLLIVTTLLRPSLAEGSKTGALGTDSLKTPGRQEYWRGVALIVVMIAWLFSMRYLGLMLSGGIAFAAIAFVTGYGKMPLRRLLVIGVCGVAVVIGFTLLMTQALSIPVPRGRIF